MTAPDERGGVESPPPPPPPRPTTNEWLPPQAFLPPETPVPARVTWSPWASSQGAPHRLRGSGRGGPSPAGWSPQRALDDEEAAQSADQVYASVDALAEAWHARLATLTDMPEFRAWERSNPTFKPRLPGFLGTAQGPRRVTVLLDTGATHCFICARLVATLGARPSGQPGPGPTSVSTAATGGTLGLDAHVLIYLGLGDVFREAMSVSPMDMDVGDDLVLGWDWILSHDLHNLCAPGRVSLRSGPALLQLDLLPASTRPAARALPVISHGGFRRLLRQIERASPVADHREATDTPLAPPGCVLLGALYYLAWGFCGCGTPGGSGSGRSCTTTPRSRSPTG